MEKDQNIIVEEQNEKMEEVTEATNEGENPTEKKEEIKEITPEEKIKELEDQLALDTELASGA